MDAATWILIPAYNEATRLDRTLASLTAYLPRIVVVDDGSSDDTNAVAARHPVHVVRHPINLGQGAALQTAIDYAIAQGAELLVTFDADGQHSAEDIERLLAPAREGIADVVLGSRFLGKSVGMSTSRWLVLKIGVVFTRLFSGIRVTDTHNGLRVLTRAAAQKLRITHDGMAHASEILDRIRPLGIHYVEVPVTITYSDETTAKGQRSWNALKIVGQLLLGRIVR
ncbi:MAG TPA: glycosyltransferase family 2 protein [Gemmataceae bacterium]|nr:glycosyltransferase family 2 protein [Gemmataceae bacterium]